MKNWAKWRTAGRNSVQVNTFKWWIQIKPRDQRSGIFVAFYFRVYSQVWEKDAADPTRHGKHQEDSDEWETTTLGRPYGFSYRRSRQSCQRLGCCYCSYKTRRRLEPFTQGMWRRYWSNHLSGKWLQCFPPKQLSKGLRHNSNSSNSSNSKDRNYSRKR